MRLIILAAGQGIKLDGFNKLLIRHPKTRETIIERYQKQFPNYEITVVTGYRAISIMSAYPGLNYIYNDQWRITGNSYSLALALDDKPCVVISADLVFDKDLVDLIEKSPKNSVIVYHSENKGLNTVRCKIKGAKVQSMYMGEQDHSDPETVGIFKISDPALLRAWKKNCCQNKNVFAGINLPCKDISAVEIKGHFFHEINSPLDYLNLIDKLRSSKK